MVDTPGEIDLETIAWHAGRLIIETGALATAEGRLIVGNDGGYIRVREGIRSIGRRRFVIAHEIGHAKLHQSKHELETLRNLTDWRTNSREFEANLFAGELLMPDFLFSPRIHKLPPSLSALDGIADEFATSNLATAVQFVNYTREPCALIVSKSGKLAWSRKSPSFEFRIRDQLHSYSAAAESWAGKYDATDGMVGVPAGAWLEDYSPDVREQIKEDTRRVPNYDMCVTLLWIDECI